MRSLKRHPSSQRSLISNISRNAAQGVLNAKTRVVQVPGNRATAAVPLTQRLEAGTRAALATAKEGEAVAQDSGAGAEDEARIEADEEVEAVVDHLIAVGLVDAGDLGHVLPGSRRGAEVEVEALPPLGRLELLDLVELLHPGLDLGGVLANKGDKVAAALHLRLAANSSDPSLRDLALRLLKELESGK